MTDEHPTFCHPGIEVTIGPESVSLKADHAALYSWAHRSGNSWPCSELARCNHITAAFDTTGLVGLGGDAEDADLSADEFNAFSSDAIGYALSPEHPCHYVTVGQFVRHGR